MAMVWVHMDIELTWNIFQSIFLTSTFLPVFFTGDLPEITVNKG